MFQSAFVSGLSVCARSYDAAQLHWHGLYKFIGCFDLSLAPQIQFTIIASILALTWLLVVQVCGHYNVGYVIEVQYVLLNLGYLYEFHLYC